MTAGVYHGSVLSPLFLIIVLEALSHMLRSGAPLEDIYVDHLVIITESLEDPVRRLLIRKKSHDGEGVEGQCT